MTNQAAHIVTANYTSVTRTYFDEVFTPAFRRIEAGASLTEKHYRIADRSICLRFYGDVLPQKLTAALVHNEMAPAATPDLTVTLWDSSGRVDFRSPWSETAYRYDTTVDVGRETVDGFRGVYLDGEQTMSFYDPATKTAHFWINDAQAFPSWLSAAPIRPILHWFLSENNTHLLHGAVVGSGNRTALLTAKGGSGKSTTALSCLLAGMDYLADDYVAVRLGDTVTAHSLYGSIKVAPDRIPEFEDIQQHVRDYDGQKSVIFLADLFPERLRASGPLTSVMIPVIANCERTEIVPAEKMAALLALLPTTLMQLPLAGTDKTTCLKEIVARTPCYVVRLGRDSTEAAQVIKEFLERTA